MNRPRASRAVYHLRPSRARPEGVLEQSRLDAAGGRIAVGVAVERSGVDAVERGLRESEQAYRERGDDDEKHTGCGVVRGERHQSMVGHCAHQIGPAVVALEGPDRARATGYSRVYLETRAGMHIYRVSFNYWELVKQQGEWRIARRTTRILGNAEAGALFRTAVGGRGRGGHS